MINTSTLIVNGIVEQKNTKKFIFKKIRLMR